MNVSRYFFIALDLLSEIGRYGTQNFPRGVLNVELRFAKPLEESIKLMMVRVDTRKLEFSSKSKQVRCERPL